MCVQTRRCHRGMKLGVRNRRQSIDVLSIYRCSIVVLSSESVLSSEGMKLNRRISPKGRRRSLLMKRTESSLLSSSS